MAMELTLLYQGELKTKGIIEDKQEIRREIHRQLKKWIEQSPFRDLFMPPSHTLVKQTRGFRFFPFAVKERDEVAELDITLLRPEPPGDIVHGGDIDNRLKHSLTALGCLKITKFPKAILGGKKKRSSIVYWKMINWSRRYQFQLTKY